MKSGREITLTAAGHAGYRDGEDIVCSAVSILGFTLMNRLERFSMGDRLDVFYEPGRLEVTARPEETDRERIEGVFETILTGYDLLAQSYPAHVTLERREANDGKGSD